MAKVSEKVKVYEIGIDELKPDPANANAGTVRGHKMIEDSVAQTGLHRGVAIDANGYLVAGNKTQQAAIDAGFKKAVVVETDGDTLVVTKRRDFNLMDDDPNNIARRAAFYDNRTSEIDLAWSAEQLLADLQSGVDLGSMFDKDELDALLNGLVDKAPLADAEPQIDKAQELLEKWKVKPGDMFSLGFHRLICGDCTDKATVVRLMQGERAQLCFTSPPYNLGGNVAISNRSDNLKQGGSAYIDYADDKTTDGYLALLNDFLSLSLSFCDYSFVNVQMLAGNKQALILFLAQWVSNFVDVAVWTKSNPQPAMAENVMNSAFEFIFVFSKQQNPTRAISTGNFRGTVSNVYSGQVNRSVDAELHGAGFPVEFASFYVDNFSSANGVIYEPFSGSGTTIIACEQLNRQCRACEISPAYVAVALDRFYTATNKLPVLISGE